MATAERSPLHRHLSKRTASAVLLLLLLLAGCTGLIFQPLQGHVLTPDRIGLAYRDVEFVAADGVRLHGWFLPASAPRQGSVLFLHGNAENVSTHIASVAWLPAAGFDVLLLDWRGYGRSAGAPSLDGLHLDFAAALETLLAMPEVDPERVVVFGQSLGGALAITALAGSPHRSVVRALVVEGAFTGYRALAREKLALFWPTWLLQWPLSLTIDDRYRPLERIGELAPLPVLIVQGAADRVVPAHHGSALFAAAGEPKQLWLLPGTGHLQAFASVDHRRRLRAWLEEILLTGPATFSPSRGAPAARQPGRADQARKSELSALGVTAPRPSAAPRAARRGRCRSAPAAAAAGHRPRSPAAPARP